MRLSGRDILHEFIKTYKDAENWLLNWVNDVEKSTWSSPHDVKKNYPSADPIGGNKMVFNVHGNKYRMQTKILYNPANIVSIEWILTHAEYTRSLKRKPK